MFGNRKVYKGITGKCGEKCEFSTYNSTKMIIIREEMNDTIKSVTDNEVQGIRMIIVKGIKERNSEHIKEVDTIKVRERKLMVIKKIMKLQKNN